MCVQSVDCNTSGIGYQWYRHSDNILMNDAILIKFGIKMHEGFPYSFQEILGDFMQLHFFLYIYVQHAVAHPMVFTCAKKNDNFTKNI